MFIYSFRAGTIKFFGIICVALAALVALIAFVPTYAQDNAPIVDAAVKGDGDGSIDYSYDKIKGVSDVTQFLSQFGWTVNAAAAKQESVTIPSEFDKVFAGYNELQRSQGLDLSKYKKKTLTRYTLEVTNYPDYEGTVYANVLVYRNKVVGGDICSADVTGFVHGFEKQ